MYKANYWRCLINIMKHKILVLGGDKRMSYAAREFVNMGFDVGVYANDYAAEQNHISPQKDLGVAMDGYGNIVMGIPLSKDNCRLSAPLCNEEIFLDDILSCVKPHHKIAVGMAGDFLISCVKRGAECTDYGAMEEFALYNATVTAEAILALLISNMPTAISDSRFLILGYGRIGKALAGMLKGMGAKVTATARKSKDFAMMDIAGINPMKTGNYGELDCFDAVINTIPHVTADEGFYVQLSGGTLIIDASSYPGYMDADCAKKHGATLIGAFGLPGKTAPATSGKIIAKTVAGIFDM